MASVPNIFEDPRVADLTETTAGEARADAPNMRAARQVEQNANLEHQAAQQAASVAKTKGRRLTGEMSTSVDKIRNAAGENVKSPVDQAVEEGRRDVVDMQAAGAERLGYVKETVANTAQEFLTHGTQQKKGVQDQGNMTSGGILPSFQGAASTVVGTASSTLSSVKNAPRTVMEAAAPAAQDVLGTAGTQGVQVKDMPNSLTGIPSTAALLESGGKRVDTMYPEQGVKDIAKNEPRKSIN